MTLYQHYKLSATAIYQQRADVYKAARQANPPRWSPSTRCRLRPEDVWIKKPPEEHELALELPLIQASRVPAQE